MERFLFVLMLCVPVNNFPVMSEFFPDFLGLTSTKQRVKGLLKDSGCINCKFEIFTRVLISRNFAYAKFREDITLVRG